MDDIDMSEYYVVRRNEYHDMKAEIDRLRATVDDLLPAWEPCRYDHDDHCQTHYLHERPCPVETLRELRNG